MFSKICCAASVWLGVFALIPPAASAQGLETLGTRPSALAAFVAVADDASAVAWNPSGLVGGPLFNLSIDLGQTTDKPSDAPVEGVTAGDGGTTLIALGTTPVGLAYYRIRTASFVVASPSVLEAADRQDRQVLVRTLVTSHLGATVQQSLGDYLTVGATIKLVRGSVGSGTVSAADWDAAFDGAEEVERQGTNRADVDLGAMFAAGRMRAGVVVRNTTAPSFGEDSVTLERHVRAGVAWADRWPGVSRTIVSVDADVTRVSYPAGERRDVAAGVERWLQGHRVGVRGGIRASTVGDARPVVSAGGSYAVRAGLYVDGFFAGGTHDHRAWGLAARVSY
jgi:hypothetical protein